MTQPIIEVTNLSKKYILNHDRQPYYTLRDTLVNLVKLPAKIITGQHKIKKENFLALSDINFSVMPGETIGIIGKNGAGKSTLLKILSQITPPTTGTVRLRGRVASLLEVGTGFNPELTGRENIFLNGAILGMKQSEIKRKFNEIVAFAEIEKFLDTPVKRYSSGMYVRLAFAVAAHLEPEILIVDEVLAVGDAQFQKKCLGKMNSISKEGGRTVLFVSHNMGAIKQLCSRGLLLNQGKSISYDSVDALVTAYQNQSLNQIQNQTIHLKQQVISFSNIRINQLPLTQSPELFSGDTLNISLDYTTQQRYDLCVGFGIRDKKTSTLLMFTHNHLEDVHQIIEHDGQITAQLQVPMLAPGEYSLEMSVWLDGEYVQQEQLVGHFIIVETTAFGSNIAIASFPAALLVRSNWTFTQ